MGGKGPATSGRRALRRRCRLFRGRSGPRFRRRPAHQSADFGAKFAKDVRKFGFRDSSDNSRAEGLQPLGGAFYGAALACPRENFGRGRGPEPDVSGRPARAQISGAACSPIGRFPEGRRMRDTRGRFGFRDFGDKPFGGRPANCSRGVFRSRRRLSPTGVSVENGVRNLTDQTGRPGRRFRGRPARQQPTSGRRAGVR